MLVRAPITKGECMNIIFGIQILNQQEYLGYRNQEKFLKF